MQVMMVGESLDFYRDADKFDSSEEEGEEADSVVMDQGLNDVGHRDVKFKALKLEKVSRALVRDERRSLRRRTREAQLALKQRERDLHYGREARELGADDQALLEGADTLRERLKAQKRAEAAYWAAMPHHQMRPQEESMRQARIAALDAAHAALAEYRQRVDDVDVSASDADARRRVRHHLREAALAAALDVVGHKDAAPVAAYEVAAAAAREVLGETPPEGGAETALRAAAVEAARKAGMSHNGVMATSIEAAGADGDACSFADESSELVLESN